MKRTNLPGLLALAVTVGVGCSEDGLSPGDPNARKDMGASFVADGGRPDAFEPCGDTDPTCHLFRLGPVYDAPFPLPGDDRVDPRVAADHVGRDDDGWLGLAQALGNLHYIWLTHPEGTVSRVDTRTMKEVGRYRTATCFSRPTGSKLPCDGQNGCCAADSQPQWLNRKAKMPEGPAQQVQLEDAPTTSAVDLNGDCFVANCGKAVTKIAGELARCRDRNNNGRIDTSSDVNHDGRIDPNDPKEYLGLDDECVLWTTNHGNITMYACSRPPQPFALALLPGAGSSDAFAGGYPYGGYGEPGYRIDGTTGAVKDSWSCAYPGPDLTIDSQGLGWIFSANGYEVCYFDTRDPANWGRLLGAAYPVVTVALDRDQNLWVGPGLARYTPDRSRGFAAIGKGHWTRPFYSSAYAIAADSRNDTKYFVWMQQSELTSTDLFRIPASELPVPKTADIMTQFDPNWPRLEDVGPGRAGVALDGEQNVISTLGNVATRIKVDANGAFQAPDTRSPPKDGERCPAGDRCDLGSPVATAGDRTGFSLSHFTAASGPGAWSYVVRGCTDPGTRTRWFALTWDADVPAHGSLAVHARSGPTAQPDASWGQWTPDYGMGPIDLAKAGVLVPNAPAQDGANYLQLEFTFKTADHDATPKLKSLAVAYRCEAQ